MADPFQLLFFVEAHIFMSIIWIRLRQYRSCGLLTRHLPGRWRIITKFVCKRSHVLL